MKLDESDLKAIEVKKNMNGSYNACFMSRGGKFYQANFYSTSIEQAKETFIDYLKRGVKGSNR